MYKYIRVSIRQITLLLVINIQLSVERHLNFVKISLLVGDMVESVVKAVNSLTQVF